jgi:cell division protein FtsQ
LPTLRKARFRAAGFVAGLDHVLGALLRPLACLVPRRLRRAAERMEQKNTLPIGQVAAGGFLFATMMYALVVGGQIGRLGDSLLVLAGLGIDDVQISGNAETSEITLLERLEVQGSLVAFDVEAAQARIAALPWVEKANLRKFYPSTLSVAVVERVPYALWQRENEVFVIDRNGVEIGLLEESRFSSLPFLVGGGANQTAGDLLAELLTEPAIAAQMRAAVLVGGRRWDLHLENGVTVKLPEKHVGDALAQLAMLDAREQLLARDVVVIDLRLPDRVTVRLPEGRSLEEIPGGVALDPKKAART